jgi:hypothetical protein
LWALALMMNERLLGLESCVVDRLANVDKHRLGRVVLMDDWSATTIIP